MFCFHCSVLQLLGEVVSYMRIPLDLLGQVREGILSVREMCLKYLRVIGKRIRSVIILWACLVVLGKDSCAEDSE